MLENVPAGVTVALEDCTMVDNHAGFKGGAIAILSDADAVLRLTADVFDGNVVRGVSGFRV
jgi:hypothetical protein